MAPASGVPVATIKNNATNHLFIQARCGFAYNFTCLQSSLPKYEAIAIERIWPKQHPEHTIKLQIWHLHTTKTPKEKTIPISHQLRTQHMVRLPDAVDTDHYLQPLIDYLPNSTRALEQMLLQRRKARTQVCHRDAAIAAVTSRLNKLLPISIANHRVGHVVGKGFEASLFSAVVVVIVVKTSNDLKPNLPGS